MATNLFKRREVEMEFIAVEKINLFYNLFTTLLIIIFYNRLSDPQSMLMAGLLSGMLTYFIASRIYRILFGQE